MSNVHIETGGTTAAPLIDVWADGKGRLRLLSLEEAADLRTQLGEAIKRVRARLPRHLELWHPVPGWGMERYDNSGMVGVQAYESWPQGIDMPSAWVWVVGDEEVGAAPTREEAMAAADAYARGLGWTLDPQPGDDR